MVGAGAQSVLCLEREGSVSAFSFFTAGQSGGGLSRPTQGRAFVALKAADGASIIVSKPRAAVFVACGIGVLVGNLAVRRGIWISFIFSK